jgi:hypothetical protein
VAVGVNEVIDETVKLDYIWADIQEVVAGDAAGMLVSGVRVISEKTRRGVCKVFPVFSVGDGLDVGRDECRVYISNVFRGCGDDGLYGFFIALVM